MQVFRDIETASDWLKDSSRNGSAITIGNYDGIHRGHLELIRGLESEAAGKKLTSMLITFEPHPQAVLMPENPPEILTTVNEKTAVLRDMTELDSVLVLEFDKSMAQIKALEFLKDWLIGKLNCRSIVIGTNHAFGYKREGDLQFLQEQAPSFGYNLVAVEPVENDGKVVNSSRIRALLKEGKVEESIKLLGHDLEFTGTVVHGRGVGREQGYPTINVRLSEEKIVLPSGVYAAYTIVRSDKSEGAGAERYYGMMYIGETEQPFDLEVNLFDFSGNLYEQRVSVYPVAYTRPSLRFDSTEALIEQIGRDEKEIRSKFNLM